MDKVIEERYPNGKLKLRYHLRYGLKMVFMKDGMKMVNRIFV